jgi:predicted RNA-binding protein with PIN domain
MAWLIIDGYNVIGVQHGDVEAERERFVHELSEYRKVRGHEIIVVFDGWKEGEGAQSESHYGGVLTIYSPIGEKADTLIKRMVDGSKQFIVVSSDREIQSHAWNNGAVPVESEDFLYAMGRAMAGTDGGQEYFEDDEDEEEYAMQTGRKKGNPKKMSKKEKALRWAMDKL